MILVSPANIDWKLEYQWDWAPWLTAILLAGLISWVIYCYKSEVSPAKHFVRGLLILLRLTTISLLLVMLSQLVFAGVRTGKPRIAILLDRSGSMQTKDVYQDQTSEPITRSDAARLLIESDSNKLLSTINNNYQSEFVVFDSEIESQTITSDQNILSDLAPVNEQSMTRLGDALIRLMSKPSSAPIQAVIAYTDGQVTKGRTLEEASGLAKRKGVPLYLVGLGDDQPKPSLKLDTLLADDLVYPDDLVNFQATLSTSFLSSQTVKAELRRNEKLVAEKMITIPEGEQQQTFPIQLIDRPTNEGVYKYSLSVSVLNDGTKELDFSDRLQHQLTVKKQQLRVLLAAGYPNYEFRYLKHLLERDSAVQLSSFLQESDPDHSLADITAIPRIPVSIDELNEYEVIVLIDIDPSLLPRSLWPQISDFVSQQGGGLALVAGPRYLPQRYLDKPAFLAMLPTKPSAGLINGWNEESGYQVQATELGKQSPTFLLADSLERSEAVWNRLPPLYWLSNVGPAKPSAQVLAYHPTYMATATKKSPAIISQYYGAGRVLLHATDSTYRWREQVGDVYFARYWGQTLRMLGKEKIGASNKKIQLSTNEDKYQVGDAVKIELSGLVTDNDESPKIRLSTAGSSDKEIKLDPVTASPGRWQANLSGLDAGSYRASLLYQETDVDIDSIDFDIESPPGELTNVTMNRLGLEKAAKTTRGKFYTYEEANLLLNQLPEGRSVALENMPPYELWNRWPFLLGITLLLCTEWIVRKRQSML